MEPKNYSTIRSMLKKEQVEKIVPYVFKMNDTKITQKQLDKGKNYLSTLPEVKEATRIRKLRVIQKKFTLKFFIWGRLQQTRQSEHNSIPLRVLAILNNYLTQLLSNLF